MRSLRRKEQSGAHQKKDRAACAERNGGVDLCRLAEAVWQGVHVPVLVDDAVWQGVHVPVLVDDAEEDVLETNLEVCGTIDDAVPWHTHRRLSVPGVHENVHRVGASRAVAAVRHGVRVRALRALSCVLAYPCLCVCVCQVTKYIAALYLKNGGWGAEGGVSGGDEMHRLCFLITVVSGLVFAPVAKWIRRWIPNPKIAGSTPAGG